MAVSIKEVRTQSDLKKFIWFGINMYKDCNYAAPPLMLDDLLNLSKGKNPALEFCDTVYLLAYKDGMLAGRIAGIIIPWPMKPGTTPMHALDGSTLWMMPKWWMLFLMQLKTGPDRKVWTSWRVRLVLPILIRKVP